MSANSENILEVKHIEVVYDNVILALHDVSLNVPRGKIVALLGANGAGKSTTLKSISNMLILERGEVTKGSIHYNETVIAKQHPTDLVHLGIVHCLEGRRCFGHLTVEENIIAGAYSRKLSKADMNQELEKIYGYFNRLKAIRKSQAGYTSGGEQQMIAVARAMMAKPKLLLLDEPSMGLAPQLVAEIFNIVKALNEKEGVSILLSEQNTNIALKVGRTLHTTSNFLEVAFGLPKAKREESLNREKCEEIVKFLELGHIENTLVGKLSYGLQKKVEFGRALATEAQVLMLDEPMAGMNVEEKRDMCRFILKVNDEMGTTIVLIEHDMGVVMDISDRVVVLDYGKVIGDGSPDEVRSSQTVIDAYLGVAHD